VSYGNLTTSIEDNILWIKISRPKKLNALSSATIAELDRAVEEAEADSAVHGIVITGEGDKAFVAGADIAELNTLAPAAAREYALRGQAVFSRIERLGKPVVAAVNGYALGGGCELAMACHLRLASANAVFGQPEVKLGLIPGYGGTQRLPRLIGRGRALELILSGRNLSAEEAERSGLVNRVVEPDELANACNELLKSILKNGPAAVARCLEAVAVGLDLPMESACLVEASLFGLGAGSEEMKEGTSAFLEKRKASFKRP
jgi:enoyl-CoA hydratase